MNIDTGEIREWAKLTEEERNSGQWVPLPSTDENGQPVCTRRDAAEMARLRAAFETERLRARLTAGAETLSAPSTPTGAEEAE